MRFLFVTLFLSSCSLVSVKDYTSLQSEMRKNVDEFCLHSKAHRDLILLGVSDLIEPHSMEINCYCEYGLCK